MREDYENKREKMYPRSSVAAVIIRDRNLLVVKNSSHHQKMV